VFGHFKMCTVLVGGFLLFGRPYSLLNLAGIATSLLGKFGAIHVKTCVVNIFTRGIFGYTYLTLRSQLSATKATKDR